MTHSGWIIELVSIVMMLAGFFGIKLDDLRRARSQRQKTIDQ
jgi:hypothetical protein